MKFWRRVSAMILPAAMMLVMAPAVAQQPSETPADRDAAQSGTQAERDRGQSPAGGTTDEDEVGRPGGDQPPATSSGREPAETLERERSGASNRERALDAAGPPSFAEADTNGDGELSTEEAEEAFPGVHIMDVNGDGMVNKSEVKTALPEIAFERNDDEVVDEDAYEEIVVLL